MEILFPFHPRTVHFPIALMAIEMGKHVYVQKPLTHTIAEARALAKAAAEANVVTQMGNQGRAAEAVLATLRRHRDLIIEAVSVGIFFKRSRSFAQLRPMQRWVALSFSLPRAVRHPPVGRKECRRALRCWRSR